MTSNDEWVRERAEWVAHRAIAPTWLEYGEAAPLIEAALQEAIERGKAEQDKAVAAERERCAKLCDGMAEAVYGYDSHVVVNDLAATIRALTLTEGQEGESNDG